MISCLRTVVIMEATDVFDMLFAIGLFVAGYLLAYLTHVVFR